MHLYFYFTYNSSALVGSAFGAIWEDPEGGFMKFAIKRRFKTRPNTPYGGETLCYSLLQGGVILETETYMEWSSFFGTP